jgi:acyl carrier protein phosphodiesterase
MNYLAHAYLSFNRIEILLGNMSSDFIKGKKKFDYPLGVQNGIALHRLIDAFTDEHPATANAKVFFKPSVGLYAGAFVDVVYDHFLANDKNQFPTNEQLQNFATNTYQQLQLHKDVLPLKLQQMLPYMQSQNWLYNYQFNWGIQKSFEGVVRRATYLNNSNEAFEAFEKNYEALQDCYNLFFDDVKKIAFQQIQLY